MAGTDIVLSTDVVVIGLGGIGLPLVRMAAENGLSVAGLDLSPAVVDGLNAGSSHVPDVTDEEVGRLLSTGFRATRDEGVLELAQVVLICVPTPVNEHGVVDLTAIENAGRAVARNMHPGMLVILSSTTRPGTTDEILAPLLEASGLRVGVDFSLAYSPSRPSGTGLAPRSVVRVVGGHSPACADRAARFYGRFVDSVVVARGTREAEMAKVLENTYQYVTLALSNELAQLSRDLGVDMWDAVRCATTEPLRAELFRPGLGLGSNGSGGMTPVDASHLAGGAGAANALRLTKMAHQINEDMPRYVARRVQDLLNRDRRALNGANVLLLGVTGPDGRDSIAADVARALIDLGAVVTYADPFSESWSVDGKPIARMTAVRDAMREAHVSVLLHQHAAYDITLLRQARRLFDTLGIVAGAERL